MRSPYRLRFKGGCGRPFCYGRASSALCDSLHGESGFTMIEMIVVMMVVGILGAIVLPRFADQSVFEVRGFEDETKALLRYAQKAPIAQRRFVCVSFSATGATLSIGATIACGAALTGPRGETPFAISAGSGTGYTPTPTGFYFDASGTPSMGQTIAVTGGGSITVEAVTGYVH